MKKKLFALMCVATLATTAFVGCGSNNDTASTTQTTEEAAPVAEKIDVSNAPKAAEGELLTGIGTSTSIAESRDASADAEGTAQCDATIAAVTVDSNGAVVECVIDVAQTKIGISADGKITSDLDAEYATKKELGDEYGMKSFSTIGKEWYEQADAFAAWTVGKTAQEISDMGMEQGLATDEDLVASCSIHVTDFQTAVLKAMNNAVAGGAKEGDKLGLGITTNISDSIEASADADGTAVAYTTMSALTVNDEGVITSSLIDAVQGKINFDAKGVITADKNATIKTKTELGDDYGMRKASAIGKEWNEQAAAYAEYTVGKTLEDIEGIAVEQGLATDEDLAASVTIHITDFNTVVAKAVASAQ